MKTMTAKELKNKTGEALREASRGKKILVTRRGKPVAVISPATEEEFNLIEKASPYGEAWQSIENTLDETTPYFANWQEAISWSRKRS